MAALRKFKILVEAQNIVAELEGQRGRFGFYAWRFIEASDREEAVRSAEVLLREQYARKILNDASDPPRFAANEVVELETFEGLKVPGTGATWFPDDAN